jgi:hypothetical protein
MAATIAAVCIAVGLPALLWFSSHFVKRTFHTATALKWPCGARGRSYRRIDMGGRPAPEGCPRAVDVGPLCSPNRKRGARLEGEQLLLIDVVNAHGAVILQTIWGTAPRSRPSPTSTTWCTGSISSPL